MRAPAIRDAYEAVSRQCTTPVNTRMIARLGTREDARANPVAQGLTIMAPRTEWPLRAIVGDEVTSRNRRVWFDVASRFRLVTSPPTIHGIQVLGGINESELASLV